MVCFVRVCASVWWLNAFVCVVCHFVCDVVRFALCVFFCVCVCVLFSVIAFCV